MVRPPHWRPLTHYVERGRTPEVPAVSTVRGHPRWRWSAGAHDVM